MQKHKHNDFNLCSLSCVYQSKANNTYMKKHSFDNERKSDILSMWPFHFFIVNRKNGDTHSCQKYLFTLHILMYYSAEFQRIARRDKKTFLSDQCKEIDENNRMGRTRDLFKKIRDTKGTFHAKMGSIKDRNCMDLTEAEDIKKRWQEYTEELYKRDLHNPDNHDGMITHLEPDILESEVKWALESITTNKASGGDGIPVELFQTLKDDAVKVLHSICQQIWKT